MKDISTHDLIGEIGRILRFMLIYTPQDAEKILQHSKQLPVHFLSRRLKVIPETHVKKGVEIISETSPPSDVVRERFIMMRPDGKKEAIELKYNKKIKLLYERLKALSNTLLIKDPKLYEKLNLRAVLGVVDSLYKSTYSKILAIRMREMMMKHLADAPSLNTVDKVNRLVSLCIRDLGIAYRRFTIPGRDFTEYLLILSTLFAMSELAQRGIYPSKELEYFLSWIIEDRPIVDLTEFRNSFIKEMIEYDRWEALFLAGLRLPTIGDTILDRAERSTTLDEFFTLLYTATPYFLAATVLLNLARRSLAKLGEKHKEEMLKKEVRAEEKYARTFASIIMAGILSTLSPEPNENKIIRYYKLELICTYLEALKKGDEEYARLAMDMKKREIVKMSYYLPPYLLDELSPSEEEISHAKKQISNILKRVGLMRKITTFFNFIKLWFNN